MLDVAGPGNFSARLVVQRDTHLPVMLMWQEPAPAQRSPVEIPYLLRRFPRRERHEVAVSDPASGRRANDRGDDVRSHSHQREDRRENSRCRNEARYMRSRCYVRTARPVLATRLYVAASRRQSRTVAECDAARDRRRPERRRHCRRHGHDHRLGAGDHEYRARCARRRPRTPASPSSPASRRAATRSRRSFRDSRRARSPRSASEAATTGRSAVLAMPKLEASVTVAQDKQEAAADRQGRRSAPCSRAMRSRRCRTIRRPSAAAPGHGRPWRGDPHRRLRGRRAAGQGADPIDSHLARSVCGGVPQRRRRVHRDHHAAGPRTDPLLLARSGMRDDR